MSDEKKNFLISLTPEKGAEFVQKLQASMSIDGMIQSVNPRQPSGAKEHLDAVLEKIRSQLS